MTKTLIAVIGLAATTMLVACASSPAPRDSFYRLEAAQPAQRVAAPVLPGVLEVSQLDADGVLSERALAYQQANGTISRYDFDLWSEPPGVLIQEQIAEVLSAARIATTVVTPDLRVPPDWSLRGRIKRFELLPEAKLVQVRLQLSVISARDGTLLLLKTYDIERPSEATPVAAVKALSQALSEALARFVADLAVIKPPVRS
jgi:ABC-type uncharacterized transport system auxiliary subunit